jgi:hypothetical protein
MIWTFLDKKEGLTSPDEAGIRVASGGAQTFDTE